MFSLIRRIQDPEHHHSLEELGVVRKAHISFHSLDSPSRTGVSGWEKEGGGIGREGLEGGGDEGQVVLVEFTPTVPHCSLATTIGLCIRTKLEASIPLVKLDVRIRNGTHHTAEESQSTTHSIDSPHTQSMQTRIRTLSHCARSLLCALAVLCVGVW